MNSTSALRAQTKVVGTPSFSYISLSSFALFLVFLLLLAPAVLAAPDGVTVVALRNETSTATQAGLLNTTGGSITTVNLNGTSQNVRWKAYVGNVTGRLSLDDANGATIYDWSVSSISGEVYTTRASGTLNWTGIGCASLNVSEHENRILNHSSADDNITATFNELSHDAFFVGTVEINANACRSVHTYVNDSSQGTNFQEVVLHDTNNSFYNLSDSVEGNVVYSTIIEQDIYGYNNETYDFQMIVPERGTAGFSSSTAYYFYAELS